MLCMRCGGSGKVLVRHGRRGLVACSGCEGTGRVRAVIGHLHGPVRGTAIGGYRAVALLDEEAGWATPDLPLDDPETASAGAEA